MPLSRWYFSKTHGNYNSYVQSILYEEVLYIWYEFPLNEMIKQWLTGLSRNTLNCIDSKFLIHSPETENIHISDNYTDMNYVNSCRPAAILTSCNEEKFLWHIIPLTKGQWCRAFLFFSYLSLMFMPTQWRGCDNWHSYHVFHQQRQHGPISYWCMQLRVLKYEWLWYPD